MASETELEIRAQSTEQNACLYRQVKDSSPPKAIVGFGLGSIQGDHQGSSSLGEFLQCFRASHCTVGHERDSLGAPQRDLDERANQRVKQGFSPGKDQFGQVDFGGQKIVKFQVQIFLPAIVKAAMEATKIAALGDLDNKNPLIGVSEYGRCKESAGLRPYPEMLESIASASFKVLNFFGAKIHPTPIIRIQEDFFTRPSRDAN